jgi:hypothetical protein
MLLILTQDRCTVCTERTMGIESFWMHPTILLGHEAQVEACLSLFGDSAILSGS